MVILERVLAESARVMAVTDSGSGSVPDGRVSDVDAMGMSVSGGASAGAAAGLLLRPAEGGGFVTGWPFTSGMPGVEVSTRKV